MRAPPVAEPDHMPRAPLPQIFATRSSAAFNTAVAPGHGKFSISSRSASAISSIDAKNSKCSTAIRVITPTSGFAICVRRASSPGMRHAHLDHRCVVLFIELQQRERQARTRCSNFPTFSERASARPEAPRKFLLLWSCPPTRPRRRFVAPVSPYAKSRRRGRPAGARPRACRPQRIASLQFRC